MTINAHNGLHFLAVLCGLTAAVIAFIDGFQTYPALYWTWAVPICLALIASGLTLSWIARTFVK